MKLKKFQMGGAMPEEQSMAQVPVEETAPAEQPQEGGDPIQQLVAVIMQLGDMAAQALQRQDPNSMGQVCEALAQFANEISQQMGGAAQPKFKKGGKFAGKKMIPQKACGSKMK